MLNLWHFPSQEGYFANDDENVLRNEKNSICIEFLEYASCRHYFDVFVPSLSL